MPVNSETTEVLKHWKELLDQGIVTQEEFDAKKKEILSDSGNSKQEKTIANASAGNSESNQAEFKQNENGNNYHQYENSENNSVGISRKATNILAYIGILWLVAYFAGDKDNCKFHLNQGLVVWIAVIPFIILLEIFTFLSASAAFTSPRLYIFLTIIIALLCVVYIAAVIAGVVFAAMDTEKRLPLIGKIKLLK